jgi:branched-chain amino acid transport system permease protein
MSSLGFGRVLVLTIAAGLILAAAPLVLEPYPLFIFAHALVFAIACLGLNLLYGTAGALSFGHATFFAISAYAGAFLYRFGALQSLELHLVAGVAASTVLAAVIGFFCVRASKIFFAILTLAFCMIVYSLFINGAAFRFFGELGWELYLIGGGSMYLPRFSILGLEFSPHAFVPALYQVIVLGFVVSTLLLWRISASKFGLALRAIRDNEQRAEFIGIPVWRYRWLAFVLSGLFVGFAGGLYGELARQITPEQLDWLFSAKLILAIVLGGSRHFLGPVVGAFVFVGVDEVASQWSVGRYAAFGALLIAVVLIVPGGITGAAVDLVGRMRRHHA